MFFAVECLSTEQISIVSMGDSLTAGLTRENGVILCAAQDNRIVASTDQPSCRGDGVEGVGGWQPALTDLVPARIFNFGNTNEVTSDMVLRFPDVLESRSSDIVLILAGTNDAIVNEDLGLTIENISSMVELTISQGRTPIIATIPPLLGGSLSSANERVLRLNELIRSLPGSFSELVVAEIYNELVDGWPSKYSADTIHFNGPANERVAQIWFEAINESRRPNNTAILVPVIDLLLDNGQ